MNTFIFIQNWGIFPNETVVCVGCDYHSIFKQLKKWGSHSSHLKNLERRKEEIIEHIENSNGFCILFEDATSLLWLRKYNPKCWEDIETLIHELHHLVLMVSVQKGFDNEKEAQAYSQIYLFKNIRKKIAI